MDKLKELLSLDWTMSAYYHGGVFFIFAKCKNDLIAIKTSSNTDLEMAVIELYEKCKKH